MEHFLQGVGKVVHSIGQSGQHLLNDLNKSYQQNVQNLQQKTQTVSNQVAQSVIKNVGNTYNSLLHTPAPKNPFIGLTPEKIVQSIGKTRALDLTPLGTTTRQLGIKGPTLSEVGNTVKNMTITPAFRIGGEAVLTGLGKSEMSFTNDPVGKFMFGDKPLQSYSNPNRPARETLHSLGFSQHDINKYAPAMIALGGILDVTPFGLGKKKAVETVTEQGVKQLTKEEAVKGMKELLTYDDKLARMGFSEQERAFYSVKQAQKLFKWTEEEAAKALQTARTNATEKAKTFLGLKNTWLAEREMATTTGVQAGSKFSDIPTKYGWDIVTAIEDPSHPVAEGARKYVPQLRNEYNKLFQEAKQAGLDIGYLHNYITHVWKQSNEEVVKAIAQKFKYAKQRTHVTYAEGIEAGLTPLYRHPAQILAEYVKRLEQTKANIRFINELKKEGIIVDDVVGRGKEGFKEITGSGFPQSISKNAQGNKVVGSYWAPTEIADEINHIFQEPVYNKVEAGARRGLSLLASGSEKLQDIHLAGGFPYTPLNAFSVTAGLFKEYLTGRIAEPTIDFVRSFSNNATDAFMASKVETIKKIQNQGFKFQPRGINDLVKKSTLEHLFHGELRSAVGTFWDNAFANKTFRNFFPMLQVSFYEDIERQALAKGMAPEEAQRVAGQALKKWYQLTENGKEMNKVLEDTLSSTLFAPKYRKAILGTWVDSLKGAIPITLKDGNIAMNNPFSMENRTGTRFLIGAILTYGLYNMAQKAFTGRYMTENPSNNQFDLLIPVSEITGNKKDTNVFRVPFLPSLLTVPRTAYNATQNILTGDTKALAGNVRNVASTALQGPIGYFSGEDYFGRPITNMKKYFYEQYNHPYLSALSQQGIGPFPTDKDKIPPLYQTLTTALELPIKYTTTEKINAGYYFDKRNPEYKALPDETKKLVDQAEKLNKDNSYAGDINYNYFLLQHPEVVAFQTKVNQEVAKSKKTMVDPFYQLPPQYQQLYLTYKTLPVGEPARADFLNEHQDFFTEFFKARDQYYAENKETFKQTDSYHNDAPKVSDSLQRTLDEYYTLPKGTGQRTAYIGQHPELVEYWNKKREYENKLRKEVGLSPVPAFQPMARRSFSHVSLKPKRVAIKKISLKIPKTKKISLKPAPLKIKVKPMTKVPKVKRV